MAITFRHSLLVYQLSLILALGDSKVSKIAAWFQFRSTKDAYVSR